MSRTTSSHRALLMQSRAMKLSKQFQLAYDVHMCRMIPQLVIILEGEMCTSDSDILRLDQKCKKMKLSQDMQLIQKLRDDQNCMKKVFEGNIVTNSRVRLLGGEIVSLTFSEAGVLHVNWISFGHCVLRRDSSSSKSSSTKGDVLEGGGVSSNVMLSDSSIILWDEEMENTFPMACNFDVESCFKLRESYEVRISQKSQEYSQNQANTDTRFRRVQKEAKEAKPQPKP
ncbi:hypothetical protein Tco_0693506 [Tanacetum coccineum]